MECCSMHLCIFAQFISHDPLACFPFSSLLNNNCALRYFLTPVLPKWPCFNWLQWWREESPVVNKPTLKISFSFFGKVVAACRDIVADITHWTRRVECDVSPCSSLNTTPRIQWQSLRLPDTQRLPTLLYFLVINQYHSFLTLLSGL